MPRVRHAVATKRRKKKILKRAKGYWGARSQVVSHGWEAVNRADAYRL